MRAAPFRGLTLALLAVVLATGCAARDPKREAAALLAAWFGLGMALSKLGRDDDARTAYARARAVAEAARVGAPPDPSH